MKLFARKKKFNLRSTLVRRYREAHEQRTQRKKWKVAKIFLQNIKTKLWSEHKYAWLSVAAVVFIGGSIGLVFFSHFFDISDIVVERVDLTTNIIPIQAKLEEQKGQNILLLNSDEVTYELKRAFPEMKEIILSKLLPRTLKIKVVEHDFVARIKSTGKTEEMLLNEIGMVRDVKMPNSNLPLIEYKNQYDLKDDKILNLLSSFLALQDRNIIMTSGEVEGILSTVTSFEKELTMKVTLSRYYPLEREIHLVTERGFSVWIDINANIEDQLRKLKSALSDFNIYKIDLSYIDLRIQSKIIYCTKNSVCKTNDQQ